MNATHKLHAIFAVLFLMFAAALVGCGGGDGSSPTTMINPIDAPDDAGDVVQSDASGQDVLPEASPDSDSSETSCTTSLGESCDEEDAVDSCTGFVCHCGKWEDPNSTTTNKPCYPDDAGEDAGVDAETDAEADVDVDAPLPPNEICDNLIDDDGDTKTDCADSDCASALNCQPEICDGQDNNGNGLKDESFACVANTSYACTTSCNTTGMKHCSNTTCTWSACTPPAEVCNDGKDNDCDQKADCADPDCNSFPDCVCSPPSIGSSCSLTPPGTYSCDPTVRCNCLFKWDYAATGDFSCATQEVCNGLDDNGNGDPDETFDCIANQVLYCTTSCGTTGQKICSNTSCEWGACVPLGENCSNGMDDDCDNKTDCQDPDCANEQFCQPEICDGLDNDGNGLKDETFACIAGTVQSCVTACGSVGSKMCSSVNCTWNACTPPAETCGNNQDDDCDTKVDCDDDDCAWAPNCQCQTVSAGDSCAGHAVGSYSCNNMRCACNQTWQNPSNSTAFACLSPQEVCNGQDDDGDNQVDEDFACVANSVNSCLTSCNSTGSSACNASCQLGACVPPSEICGNGTDDDCDGAPDCWDSDCQAAVNCQHDFGTCDSLVPSNEPYTCSTGQQDVVPDGMLMVRSGCANSLTDQFLVGGTGLTAYIYHLTGGTIWTNTPLPVQGNDVMDVACMGSTNTYAISVNNHHGSLLRWNGSSWAVIASHDAEFGAMHGFTSQLVWIYGRNGTTVLDGAAVYVWDGVSLTEHKLPTLYAPMTFHAKSMWGTGPSDVYLAGNTYDPQDPNDFSKYAAALMHFDGSSWGKVTLPNSNELGLVAVSGFSSCDVGVVGIKKTSPNTQGLYIRRNGSSWLQKTFANVGAIQDLVLPSGWQTLLLADVPAAPSETWIGTSLNESDFTWKRDFNYLSSGSSFWHGGATWAVPNTSPQVIMTAGDGKHGSSDPSGYGDYVHVFRSTCQ